jgi:hypothetical protein
MDTESRFKTKNKKALSTVIATVLLILLVVVTTTMVWVSVRNFIKPQMEKQKCFEIESSDKISINDYYTCYEFTTNNEVQFSISIADVEIDALIVTILAGGNSRSFTLTNEDTAVENLKPYNGNYGEPVKLPGKNEGKTYVATGFDAGAEKVDSIKIAAVLAGKQCGPSDQTLQVENCNLFED